MKRYLLSVKTLCIAAAAELALTVMYPVSPQAVSPQAVSPHRTAYLYRGFLFPWLEIYTGQPGGRITALRAFAANTGFHVNLLSFAADVLVAAALIAWILWMCDKLAKRRGGR